MLILALDTSTPAVGAAVVCEAGCLAVAGVTGAARHGEMLAPMAVEALRRAAVAPSDLDAIAVGTGPGPFTGLRVGLVHARVMGLALDVPVHGVCSLDVLAQQVRDAHPDDLPNGFLVATDARRREVYWAGYDAAGCRIDGPQVGAAAAIPGVGGLPAFGAGALLYGSVMQFAGPPEYPDPAVLGRMVAARILRGEEPAPPDPMYLRRPDATPNAKPKRVLT
jgi:tRNA threonylcarbamoyl adenosine modification protein YeaZ